MRGASQGQPRAIRESPLRGSPVVLGPPGRRGCAASPHPWRPQGAPLWEWRQFVLYPRRGTSPRDTFPLPHLPDSGLRRNYYPEDLSDSEPITKTVNTFPHQSFMPAGAGTTRCENVGTPALFDGMAVLPRPTPSGFQLSLERRVREPDRRQGRPFSYQSPFGQQWVRVFCEAQSFWLATISSMAARIVRLVSRDSGDS